MQLIVTEKPSVAQAIAAALDIQDKKVGYLEGSGYLVSWCVGHLVELAPPEQYLSLIHILALQHNSRLLPLDFQQESGLISCLPLGVNKIGIQRGLTTCLLYTSRCV